MKHRAVGRDGVAVQHFIHLQGVESTLLMEQDRSGAS